MLSGSRAGQWPQLVWQYNSSKNSLASVIMVALVRSCQSSHAYTGDKLYSVLCSKGFFITSTCCYGRMTMVSGRCRI